jgi:hypothetical protein
MSNSEAKELGRVPHAVPVKPDVFSWLKEAAEAKGLTVAQMADRALRQWFGRE